MNWCNDSVVIIIIIGIVISLGLNGIYGICYCCILFVFLVLFIFV